MILFLLISGTQSRLYGRWNVLVNHHFETESSIIYLLLSALGIKAFPAVNTLLEPDDWNSQ